MSHDRGCPCGKEKYEYDDCTKPTCVHKQKTRRASMINPNPNCDQECRFTSDGGSMTCMGWTDVYDKNGNLVSGGNPNIMTEVVKCVTCGASWTTESQRGEVISTKELLFG